MNMLAKNTDATATIRDNLRGLITSEHLVQFRLNFSNMIRQTDKSQKPLLNNFSIM